MDNAFIINEPGGEVRYISPGRSRVITELGRWPVWNPRGDSVAVSVQKPGGEGGAPRIEHFSLDGTPLGTLHSAPEGASPFIAPGVPHYGLWSPDGDILSYVAPTPGGLGLFLSRADDRYTARHLTTGSPLFLAWTSDSRQLICHQATGLRHYDREGQKLPSDYEQTATGFRTPAVSGDGSTLVLAEARSDGVAVLGLAHGAEKPVQLARYGGAVAFAARPGYATDMLVASTAAAEAGMFNRLSLIDVREVHGRAEVVIWRGPFAAAWWSPTGSQVAIVVPTQSGDGRYAITVADTAGTALAATEPFLPSVDYRTYLGFFDQYTKSHHTWSADGAEMLLAGRLGGDGVSSAFGDPLDYVFGWRVGRGAALECIGPGHMAVFSPQPAPQ